jgi:hypothetical protein
VTPVKPVPSWVPKQAEKVVKEYQKPSTVIDNKINQSNTATQTGTVVVIGIGNTVNFNQSQNQSNSVVNNVDNSVTNIKELNMDPASSGGQATNSQVTSPLVGAPA